MRFTNNASEKMISFIVNNEEERLLLCKTLCLYGTIEEYEELYEKLKNINKENINDNAYGIDSQFSSKFVKFQINNSRFMIKILL